MRGALALFDWRALTLVRAGGRARPGDEPDELERRLRGLGWPAPDDPTRERLLEELRRRVRDNAGDERPEPDPAGDA